MFHLKRIIQDMKLSIPKGTYVVAVSGGVDSVVLLDLLVKQYMLPVKDSKKQTTDNRLQITYRRLQNTDSGVRFVIAHYDHGIREDSEQDRQLVQEAAQKYKLPFVYNEGKLGPGASEAKAREARYNFLKKVQKASGASAIITAHHQDDVIETAILNMLRGTKRLGITSLKNRPGILRPMLHIPKVQIRSYAEANRIVWREDSTNSDTKYLRNHIRHKILPKFTKEQRKQFLAHIDSLMKLNQDIDEALDKQLKSQVDGKNIDRHWFIMLPHTVAVETMAGWLRENDVSIDSKRLELLVRGAKTMELGKQMPVDSVYCMEIGKQQLALKHVER